MAIGYPYILPAFARNYYICMSKTYGTGNAKPAVNPGDLQAFVNKTTSRV